MNLSLQEDEIIESKVVNSPEKKTWFRVLFDTIEMYLCGLGERFREHYFLEGDHHEAEEWIFDEDQDRDNSFNEIWSLFYDISPEIAKCQMKMVWEDRYKKYIKLRREHAKIESVHREWGTESCSDDISLGDSETSERTFGSDAWVESFIFG